MHTHPLMLTPSERADPSCAKYLTAHLRESLADVLAKNAPTLAPDVVAALRPWTEEANIEGLAEWLGKEGWGKVDGDKVEARLVKAAWEFLDRDKRTNDSFRICFYLPQGAKTFSTAWIFRYELTRAEAPKGGLSVEITWHEAPQGEPPPPKVAVYAYGLDALKTGLEFMEWQGLAECIPVPEKTKENDWLRLLAGAWLQDRANRETERHERAALAVPFAIRPKARTSAGNDWTPLPRALTPAAAMGGPFAVDVDGETYAQEPDFAGAAVGHALRPRGLDIVPADWLGNPAQMTLALQLDAPAVKEYLIETAARTATLTLPHMCPKLLGFMFAAAPMTARPVKGTLLELAHWIYPDWKDRRQSKRDLQGLGAAFVAVKSLRLVETKPDGTRHPYDLFTVDYDLSCKPDASLGFMINPWLADRMQGGTGGGFFLLNMTRWLSLGIQNPRLFPLALRLAALWDEARKGGVFDPARLHTIEADRLAAQCNTLSPGAAMYRAGKTDAGAAKQALKDARANLEADLNALKDAGLLGDWTKRKIHGKGFELLPVPPADYAEACKRAAHTCRKPGSGRPPRKLPAK